jgi:hypothetical protein
MTPCDTVCQNCGGGRKCTVLNNATISCAANGSVGAEQFCSGTNGNDTCFADGLCVGVGTNKSVCAPFCRTNADCNGGHCDFPVGTTAAKTCSSPVNNCNPVQQTGCSSGGCYTVTVDGLTGCHATGTSGANIICQGDYDCLAGFACLYNGTDNRCYKLCHLNSTECMPMGQTCLMVTYNNGTMSWATYGVCN